LCFEILHRREQPTQFRPVPALNHPEERGCQQRVEPEQFRLSSDVLAEIG
jgi:hypothetical protein